MDLHLPHCLYHPPIGIKGRKEINQRRCGIKQRREVVYNNKYILMEAYITKEDERLWVCTECGKTTAGYDGDYLISHTLHLSCQLEKEIKKELSVNNQSRRKGEHRPSA